MRRFYKFSIFAIFIILLLGVYSLLIEPNVIRIKHLTVKNQRLAAAFKDLKVIFIADIEVYRDFRYRDRSLIEKVNSLKPDIIFIAGGLVTSRDSDYRQGVALIKSLKVRLGTWMAMGDGDYRVKEPGEFIRALKEAGVHVLRNETAPIRLGEGRVVNIIGLDDTVTNRHNLTIASSKKVLGAPEIILAHSVEGFTTERADGISADIQPKADSGGMSKETEWTQWKWEPYDYDGFNNNIGILFEKDGRHTMRAQIRECGIRIDRIVLKAVATKDKKTILDPNKKEHGDIIINASDVKDSDMKGTWKRFNDPTAYCNVRVDDNVHYKLFATPLPKPKFFFDVVFDAKRGQEYRMFIRRRSHAECNGSVWVQFDDSVDRLGNPRYRIGQALPAYKADLVLVGHTHGGQMILPWWKTLKEFSDDETRYIRGSYRIGEADVYVSPGVGLSNDLPVRFLVPPEITVLEFKS